MNTPIWKPTAQRIENANLTQFMRYLDENDFGTFYDYDALWNWTVENIGPFWSTFWDFSKIEGSKGSEILRNGEDVRVARFFPDAKINYAENILQRKDGIDPAIVFHSELGARSEWTWAELRQTVSQLQQALKASGVVAGDRVAGLVPNTPHTVAAALAASSLGAIWCSCSPDFGVSAAMDRISQIKPKILFCADGYTYNGKRISTIQTAADLAKAIPSVEKVVIFPLLEDRADISPVAGKGTHFADYIAPFPPRTLTFERVRFNDPLYIMFSSGTTGLPKCIVHSVGGVLLQHLKEHALQADLKPGDRMLYFTTCGWMMWNWMVSALGSSASVVLYDGSPFYPDGNRLADIVAIERVTHFGTSAKYLDACAKARVRPTETHDLEALRTILSTGSPLSSAGFDYVYRDWKRDVCLSSIAGGTDILGCFVGGSPISPVYRGECQKRHLAMDVRVFDEDGRAVTGKQGELVCCRPHPSMPIGFWDDPDGSRYTSAYFETFENVWHQGDFVALTENNGMIFYGRSDAVLNPGGVRIGTAEIYRVVEAIDEVIESVVVGQNIETDQRVVLFVKLRNSVALTDDLTGKIRAAIRSQATPRHVPAIILEVADIPRTKSGKIAEIAVRDTIAGKSIKNSASLANPEAIEFYRNRPELEIRA